MNDILGLLDSMEALLLDCPKIPMTDKLVIEEKRILQLIDKIRISVKNGGVARESIDINKNVSLTETTKTTAIPHQKESMQEAYEKAKKIKQGANDYAEYVLSNLQLSISKLQNQLLKLEKNVENGREVLEKQKTEEDTFGREEENSEIG